MNERLYKSTDDKVLAGVCGGIGHYFEIDPVLIRLIWAILFFAFGAGLVAYIVAAIIMPSKEEAGEVNDKSEAKKTYDQDKSKKVMGSALIVLGAFFLSRRFLGWIDYEMLAAGGLIILGVYLFIRRKRDDNE